MTTPHTPPAALDLAAIEARAAAATPARERIAQRFGENTAVIQHATDVVLASAADVPALLAHITALRAQHAGDVAAAVAGERARCAAVCRDIASDATDDDPVSETADECAEAIERASAPTGGAQ